MKNLYHFNYCGWFRLLELIIKSNRMRWPKTHCPSFKGRRKWKLITIKLKCKFFTALYYYLNPDHRYFFNSLRKLTSMTSIPIPYSILPSFDDKIIKNVTQDNKNMDEWCFKIGMDFNIKKTKFVICHLLLIHLKQVYWKIESVALYRPG